MIYTIELLISKLTENDKSGYDLNKIMDAYELANSSHEGQKRSSGEPYISHPIAVAYLLLDFKMDTDTIVAALLHDVVEDSNVELSYIKKRFGGDVALMVDGVTKIGMIPLNYTKEEQHAENIRKILLAMSQDVRVILIKLADRLHNLRTLEHRPPEKQRGTALETMSFYTPIAHRLGMNELKEEMEDISLRYLDPYGFKSIDEQVSHRKEQRELFIEKIMEMITERIGEMEPVPSIAGRVKSNYSIYKKVIVDGKNFDEIYDIYAVRIIVQSVIECYNILGIIHDMFRPIPFRFKDYIATPKPNRYQSLHTTVIGRDGIPFEVQIRTVDMHNTAEYGVAAHWKYKVGLVAKQKNNPNTSDTGRLEWLRHVLDQHQESGNVEHISEAIKTDLASEDVYVFSPKGDIITLPLGSNVIDFAYAIHSQVGNKMTGARVGGRMVKFEYQLVTGDIVDIMTTNSSSYGPNRNWLDIVKTSSAKAKIRAWFRKERRSENIVEGKNSLERELKRNSLPFDDELILVAAKELRFEEADEFYASIGYGGTPMTRVIHKVKEIYNATAAAASVSEADNINLSESIAKKQSKGVVVEGIDNCLVRFANCCTPLPGDKIIGFVTRGYGVSVHKSDCANVSSEKRDRLIKVKWVHLNDLYYRAAIDVVAENRVGLILDVTSVIFENKLSIDEINAKKLKNGNACIEITLEIANVEQLKNIIAKLQKIRGVIVAMRRDS
ncbi:MAG: bifunctional (p)ppGpp synthetase/guanosine-3',5'-bis(diphosphate) 3'-pyrophosphohydrolase [Oscillospiraceae bacterium]|nr:bifunctional (p)ppGpp synthetase/guanosine-3',5'-bis(diphosphate) 3'-pyrophosphohydrolase [Oscillospiraceae bacterium]